GVSAFGSGAPNPRQAGAVASRPPSFAPRTAAASRVGSLQSWQSLRRARGDEPQQVFVFADRGYIAALLLIALGGFNRGPVGNLAEFVDRVFGDGTFHSRFVAFIEYGNLCLDSRALPTGSVDRVGSGQLVLDAQIRLDRDCQISIPIDELVPN